MQTPYGQTNVPDWFDKLQNVVQSQEQDDQIPEEQEVTREEWMILFDLNTSFENSEGTPESTYNWQADRTSYTGQQIHEMDKNKVRGLQCPWTILVCKYWQF